MRNLDVKSLGKIFELLNSHYPERLAGLWFVNAPWIFWGAWRVVSPFVDPATRQKIRFASAAPGSAPPELAKAVPPSVLPKAYGGQAELVPVQDAVTALRLRSAAPGRENGLPGAQQQGVCLLASGQGSASGGERRGGLGCLVRSAHRAG